MEVSGRGHAPAAYPWASVPASRWIGGWVGPRTCLDALARRKISCPCREMKHSRPARSLVTILIELS
jgi:hypothetical protein